MIDLINIINSDLGFSVIMDRDNSDYLIDDNGLDWGEVTSAVSTINTLDGYGAILNNVYIPEPRPISIRGWVVGTEQQMAQKKNKLKQVLSLKSNIRIEIPVGNDNYYINAYVARGLYFSMEYRNNNEKMCKFTVSFEAPYPFFCLDKFYGEAALQQMNYQVLNLGSIPVGVQLTLAVDSSVTDPYASFTPDDQLYPTSILQWLGSYPSGVGTFSLNTEYGLKDFKVGGTRSLAALDLENSDWLMMPVSKNDENFIIIGCSSGMHPSAIQYTEAHISLGGM